MPLAKGETWLQNGNLGLQSTSSVVMETNARNLYRKKYNPYQIPFFMLPFLI